MPNPSRARLRVQRPPAFSVCPPVIQVRLSLTENAFCRSVRSTFRPASAMLVGAVGARRELELREAARSAREVGGVPMPSWAATSPAMNVLWRVSCRSCIRRGTR